MRTSFLICFLQCGRRRRHCRRCRRLRRRHGGVPGSQNPDKVSDPIVVGANSPFLRIRQRNR